MEAKDRVEELRRQIRDQREHVAGRIESLAEKADAVLVGGTLIAKPRFDALSPALQQALRDTGRQAHETLNRTVRRDDDRFYEALTSHGMTAVDASAHEAEWRQVPLTHGRTENSRSLGVADMAHALRSGRPHRASGELAYHVLDVMQSFAEASASGRHVELASSCQRPAPLPVGLAESELDP